MRRQTSVVGLFVAFFLAFTGSARPASAAITEEQQKQVAEIEQALKETLALVKAKKVDEAEPLVTKVKESLDRLATSEAKDELADTISTLNKKLAAVERLVAKGKAPAEPADTKKPAAGKRPAAKPKGKPSTKDVGKSDEISFTKQIAPILAGRCASCHIRQTRGGFNMATYAALKKGSTENGVVFTPGKGEGSRLVEVLQSGDMPRGGGPLKPEEIALISKWIDAGAKFDGTDENSPIAAATPDTNQPQQPALQVAQASGKESVQFVRDLAPIIVSTCIDCHGGMQPSGRLTLTTFAALLRGGDSGQIVSPSKPAESLLVKKLKGTAGQRMPLRKEPLDDATIQKFETWIADGAKLDWPDPNEALDWAVRVMVASKMSHDELSAMRSELADKNWRLGSPDVTPQKIEDEQFILVGNLAPIRMMELVEQARGIRGKVAKAFNLPVDEPFFKGRLTLFAFKRHFDYTEFGTMVERRELPTEWHGHWRYNVVDCYGCALVPDDNKGVDLILAEIFAGSYIENQAKMPRWFAEGAARAIAARVVQRDSLAKQWDEDVKQALANGRGPDDFLKAGDVLSADSGALSYGFMKGLVGRMPKFVAMLNDLHQGTPFDAAFKKNFGGDPAALAAGWAQREAYSRRK
ncbi:MAG TPA: c-type cytochrome domain-containing protein [Pirellulales bacterium]|nr:c-type cytochrome domain-containing protein [Pirellulales bacterium]